MATKQLNGARELQRTRQSSVVEPSGLATCLVELHNLWPQLVHARMPAQDGGICHAE
jgi:hypothetical protein